MIFVPAIPGSELKRRYLSAIAKVGVRIGVAELQRTDPGTKVVGEFSSRDRTFPPNARNGF